MEAAEDACPASTSIRARAASASRLEPRTRLSFDRRLPVTGSRPRSTLTRHTPAASFFTLPSAERFFSAIIDRLSFLGRVRAPALDSAKTLGAGAGSVIRRISHGVLQKGRGRQRQA